MAKPKRNRAADYLFGKLINPGVSPGSPVLFDDATADPLDEKTADSPDPDNNSAPAWGADFADIPALLQNLRVSAKVARWLLDEAKLAAATGFRLMPISEFGGVPPDSYYVGTDAPTLSPDEDSGELGAIYWLDMYPVESDQPPPVLWVWNPSCKQWETCMDSSVPWLLVSNAQVPEIAAVIVPPGELLHGGQISFPVPTALLTRSAREVTRMVFSPDEEAGLPSFDEWYASLLTP